ncbi:MULTISPECIES: hypothetical protein [Rhodococcus]|uniref:Uncharacterized protein n=1 Tax=Rhodococcus opacus RKJ300 = JCM 13270 TaxID=1165867 RepID=I0WN34_RHOOP|nr:MULTISPECIES: hypothetical protein [Rhodococcus]EID77800.1 hypothetical protein W59_21803 [Rhodococcus opacus RKJ300 = JCM 13270]QQZ14504.1 hypothetical protein GO592_33655 [Rhodococcus sp. 21391]
MTTGTVRIERAPDGVWIITPDDAPSVLDDTAGIDVAVLEVLGGHLSWSVLADHTVPVAVLDDVASAQDWVWAVFGEEVALAVAAGSGRDVTVSPARPRVADGARRLAYAHWAARWWPTSTIDAVPPLDEGLLNGEIATLVEECDLLVDGDDSVAPTGPALADRPGRAEDYALAAGAAATLPSTLVLARGTTGSDWRRYPPGLVDASERAVSWVVVRAAGNTTVRVSIVAAPGLSEPVPEHVRPHALVGTASGAVDVALRLSGDSWFGESAAPPGSESGVSVDVYLPGFGVNGHADDGGPEARERVRALVRRRLRRAAKTVSDDGPDSPLLAEIAAAASDSDF